MGALNLGRVGSAIERNAIYRQYNYRIHGCCLGSPSAHDLYAASNETKQAAHTKRCHTIYFDICGHSINHMLIIKAENGVSEIPVVIDGSLQTSKQNKSLHGWGLKSALNAAERYEGTV